MAELDKITAEQRHAIKLQICDEIMKADSFIVIFEEHYHSHKLTATQIKSECNAVAKSIDAMVGANLKLSDALQN